MVGIEAGIYIESAFYRGIRNLWEGREHMKRREREEEEPQR